VLRYGCIDFQSPPYKASRQLMIPRIAATGTWFSPLPCQALHGYMFTSAHHVEVEVGADGPASAPLSGAATAALPAGALVAGNSNLGGPLAMDFSMGDGPPASHNENYMSPMDA
jgi:hypothetical protein